MVTKVYYVIKVYKPQWVNDDWGKKALLTILQQNMNTLVPEAGI